MKKLLLAVAMFCSLGAMAQDPKMDDGKMDHKMKDCVMRKYPDYHSSYESLRRTLR